MLAISVGQDISLIKPYLEKYNLTFPVLLDPGSKMAKKKYRTIGLPETYVLDKTGLIVHKAVGPRNWDTRELIEAFEQMISGK